MNKSDLKRNGYMLRGKYKKKGYDWWWHSFTAKHEITTEEKAFYIEYYVTNPSLSPNEVMLGQSSERHKPSYVMINAGTWGDNKKQIHQYYPTSMLSYDYNKLNLSIADCSLTENHLKGSCETSEIDASNPAFLCDAGKMSWDLNLNKKIAYNVGYGAGKLFRSIKIFEMYWHAEGIKTQYDGHVILDGEKYIVEKENSFGYSDKNWGSDFTSPWLWISSCHLFSKRYNQVLKNSAIQIGGGRPKVLGIHLNRKLLIGIFYEGQMIEFNFSKFWKRNFIDFSFEEKETLGMWQVTAKNKRYSISLELYCKLDEMLKINYEAPNGKKLHNNLLNGGTGYGNLKLYENNQLIDELDIRNAGCEYGEY
jgi:hypothetical protein